ncbi:hypothetical protein RCL1_006617 [Eukaryota sp. TZLM3-RCL]
MSFFNQVYAVVVKNLQLLFVKYLRVIGLFVIIPLITLWGIYQLDRFDFERPNPVIYDPFVQHLSREYRSMDIHVSTDSKYDSNLIGQLGPHAQDNAGVFSYADWYCKETFSQDCPYPFTVVPSTVLHASKDAHEDALYADYGQNEMLNSIHFAQFSLSSTPASLSIHAYLTDWTDDRFHSPLYYDFLQPLRNGGYFLSALLHYLNNVSSTPNPFFDTTIVPAVSSFPYIDQEDGFTRGQMNTVYIIGILIFPLILLNFISEKKDKILSLCRVMGLSDSALIAGNLIFGSIIYSVLCLALVVPGYYYDFRAFSHTSPLVFIILFIIYGAVLASMALLCTPVLPSPTLATIFSIYMFIMIVVSGNSDVFNVPQYNPSLGFIPWYPIYHSYMLVARNACWEVCDGTNVSNFSIFFPHVLSSLLNILIYSVVGFYLMLVFSGSRIRIPFLTKYLARKFNEGTEADVEATYASLSPVTTSDLVKERALAIQNHDLSISAVDCTKIYSPKGNADKVIALNNASLALRKNTLRSCLGVNGSGKTTFINILTGQLRPTSVLQVLVNSFNIFSHLEESQRNMGFIPQQSLFWSDLTLYKHLQFFGRLKLQLSEVPERVDSVIRQLGLQESKYKKLATLSGGQKRRACLAMALVGNPTLIIGDEISCGLSLDVASQLWSLIRKTVDSGVSMLVSTHSMKEAEVISDSISIQKKGDFMCIGTHDNLIVRFGMGYRLFVSCHSAAVMNVMKLVQSWHPEVSHFSTIEGVLQFHLPKELALLTVFSTLNQQKSQLGIIDFGILNSSLDDVFLSVNE